MSKETTGNGWLIENWLPKGHRVLDTSTEGSFKTMTGCRIAVSVASGKTFLERRVEQGSVLIVDEETPEPDLHRHLERFSLGLGYNSWHDLPIEVLSMTEFRFDRSTKLAELMSVVKKVKPALIRIDSVLACLPGGRQGMGENNAEAGIAIRDDLNEILKQVPECVVLLSAHSKKFVGELGLKHLKQYEMQSLVRGHGSIVGEACDTGVIIKKISEYPEPTRFVILTRARRRAIPMSSKDVYVELEEERYGEGWARLTEIQPLIIPPSSLASRLYPLFKDESISASTIVRLAAFNTKKECETGVDELLERRVIIEEAGSPFEFRLNPQRRTQADKDYLSRLEAARPEQPKSHTGGV